MGGVMFDNPEAIEWFRYTVIASAAALYINTGMKPNRAYTPTKMRDILNSATGSKAKHLKDALLAYVEACENDGFPVTNPLVLKAVGRGQ